MSSNLIQKNISLLKQILLQNGYPSNLINKLLFSCAEDLSRPFQHVSLPPPNNVGFIVLPYIRNLTPKLTSLFKDKTRIAHKTILTIKSVFTNVKFRIPDKLKSDIIYKIPCKDCNMIYIGQTSQTLHSRIISHKSDCRNDNKQLSSALTQHVHSTKHDIDYDSANILDSEHNYNKRLFLEMCNIQTSPNTMNKRTDTSNLSNIYTYLINFHKN